LAISDQAVVLDHGEVVHAGSAQELRDQPELLDKLLGVTTKLIELRCSMNS
jgi:branched-chain amino acid transport system ATP-binding protein